MKSGFYVFINREIMLITLFLSGQSYRMPNTSSPRGRHLEIPSFRHATPEE
jgi:hypothetical protein